MFSLFIVCIELSVFSYEVFLYFVRFCGFCHLYFETCTSALSQLALLCSNYGRLQKGMFSLVSEKAIVGQLLCFRVHTIVYHSVGSGVLCQGRLWPLTDYWYWHWGYRASKQRKEKAFVTEHHFRYTARMCNIQLWAVFLYHHLHTSVVFGSVSKMSYLLVFKKEK